MSQPMMWIFAVLVVLVMGGVAVVAAGRGEPMEPAYDDRPDALVPADRALAPDDLRRVRFSLAFRGYRMSEVDELLARLAAEMEGRSPRPSPAGGEAGSPPPLAGPPPPPVGAHPAAAGPEDDSEDDPDRPRRG